MAALMQPAGLPHAGVGAVTGLESGLRSDIDAKHPRHNSPPSKRDMYMYAQTQEAPVQEEGKKGLMIAVSKSWGGSGTCW